MLQKRWKEKRALQAERAVLLTRQNSGKEALRHEWPLIELKGTIQRADSMFISMFQIVQWLPKRPEENGNQLIIRGTSMLFSASDGSREDPVKMDAENLDGGLNKVLIKSRSQWQSERGQSRHSWKLTVFHATDNRINTNNIFCS